MSNVAISVEGLGKRYRIGAGPAEPYGNIRESLIRAAGAPLRRLRGGASGGGATRDAWALKDVSFEVKHGEAVGIIGRNGAGKSTLLKVLSRITEPTTGQAIVHGRVGSLLEVGTGFHPELTGRENIYLNGAVMGMSRADIKRRFDEIVDFSGVETYLDTPVKRYSSGMYMRLAFAVAAHLEPEVLVVDEVLAVGDAGFQKKCLGKMSQVAGQGRTVLFVSHNMAAIGALCTSAILLNSSRVVNQGTAVAVIENYMRQLGRDEQEKPLMEQSVCAEQPVRIKQWGMSVDPRDSGVRSFKLGEPLQLWIDYECHASANGYLLFSFSLQDSLGNVVMVAHNELEEYFISAEAGDDRLSACIQNVNLRPGNYFLYLDVLLNNASVASLSLGNINIVASPFFPNYLPDRFPALAVCRRERTDGAHDRGAAVWVERPGRSHA